MPYHDPGTPPARHRRRTRQVCSDVAPVISRWTGGPHRCRPAAEAVSFRPESPYRPRELSGGRSVPRPRGLDRERRGEAERETRGENAVETSVDHVAPADHVWSDRVRGIRSSCHTAARYRRRTESASTARPERSLAENQTWTRSGSFAGLCIALSQSGPSLLAVVAASRLGSVRCPRPRIDRPGRVSRNASGVGALARASRQPDATESHAIPTTDVRRRSERPLRPR